MLEQFNTDQRAVASFGTQLRALRLRAGLSRAALAARADLGVATLKALEQVRQRPRIHTRVRLADALGLAGADRDDLLQGAEEASNTPAGLDSPRLPKWLTSFVGRERELETRAHFACLPRRPRGSRSRWDLARKAHEPTAGAVAHVADNANRPPELGCASRHSINGAASRLARTSGHRLCVPDTVFACQPCSRASHSRARCPKSSKLAVSFLRRAPHACMSSKPSANHWFRQRTSVGGAPATALRAPRHSKSIARRVYQLCRLRKRAPHVGWAPRVGSQPRRAVPRLLFGSSASGGVGPSERAVDRALQRVPLPGLPGRRIRHLPEAAAGAWEPAVEPGLIDRCPGQTVRLAHHRRGAEQTRSPVRLGGRHRLRDALESLRER